MLIELDYASDVLSNQVSLGTQNEFEIFFFVRVSCELVLLCFLSRLVIKEYLRVLRLLI